MALNGIDIASHQAGLDLNNIAFDFVIIKATQGIGYVNPYCDNWYQQAKALGKLIGFYHYASGNDAVAEADYFIENTLNYFHEAVPCLDWEADENDNWGDNDAAWCKAFCDRIYERTGVHPMVYVQASAMSRLEGQIGDCGLWIAQYPNYVPTGYQDEPWNEGAYTCAIRQYSSAGRLDGWGGNLDLDKFYGDAAAWMKYANPSGDTPTPEPNPITPSPAPEPAPSAPSGFAVGDIVVPTAMIDYNGNSVTSYYDNYTLSELNGDRAVLSVGSTVWCAMNIANISKVGDAPAQPAQSYSQTVSVGDRVIPCSDTDYNGTAVTKWQDTYTVSEINGDRAVLVNDNGDVWCAMHVADLKRD